MSMMCGVLECDVWGVWTLCRWEARGCGLVGSRCVGVTAAVGCWEMLGNMRQGSSQRCGRACMVAGAWHKQKSWMLLARYHSPRTAQRTACTTEGYHPRYLRFGLSHPCPHLLLPELLGQAGLRQPAASHAPGGARLATPGACSHD